MADRVIPPSGGSGDSGERRPAAPRPAGEYSDHPQPTRVFSVNGERTAPSRSAPQRSQSARGGSASGERRSSGSRVAGSSGARQSSPRRVDVIRCENCGEDYNVSYKRCPFCDERPGRGGVSGRRVSNTRGGGYGRPVNPIQIAGLVISLVLIASALFIVIRFLGAPIFGNKNKPNNSGSDVSSSQSSQSNAGTLVRPNTPKPTVQSIVFNNTDLTLNSADTYQIIANLLPEGAEGDVTWTSSDTAAAVIDSSGLLTNVNTRDADVVVTITAACGDVTASTTVTCKGKSIAGSTGRVINAQSGLNIRSGPGKDYGVVASAQNGSTVTILGEENGFYKINYSGDKVGYVSKDYVSIIS